jgi:uncharacterized membrane protein
MHSRWVSTLKGIILFPTLFYLTVYAPLVFIVYLPYWYKINCNWNERCDMIGYERAETGFDDLTSFFLHKGELVSFWTKKEKLHLAEVRDMFDKMFVIAIICVICLILTFDRGRVSRFAIANSAIILAFLVVLPFFTTFWREVFHPLLFNNQLWMNNRSDLSFYIMPRQFFKYTTVLLVASSVILNLAIWSLSRKRIASPR